MAEIRTLGELEAAVDGVFLLADRSIVKTVCAVVVANKMDLDPVWLFLVAGSSAGKTELVNALEGLDFIHPIDTLTVNTFASGQKRQGQETSLLLRINDGIITFKDFTAILEMNKDTRKEIMSQLRAIFDGKFVKRTGTGDDIMWSGKLGMIAAVTSVIHVKSAEFSAMGERFIQYAIRQPDRKNMARRVFKNAHGMEEKRKDIQKAFTEYITGVLSRLEDKKVILSEEVQEQLINIANYSTMARSGLIKNERDPYKIEFIPDPEMPGRVLGQLYTIASSLIAMNKADAKAYPVPVKEQDNIPTPPEHDDLPEADKQIIYKISLDSIPRKRRVALQILARYSEGATTSGLAIQAHYHTDVMKETLYELNALGFCERRRDAGTDRWHMPDEWRKLIMDIEKLTEVKGKLVAEDAGEDMAETVAEDLNNF